MMAQAKVADSDTGKSQRALSSGVFPNSSIVVPSLTRSC